MFLKIDIGCPLPNAPGVCSRCVCVSVCVCGHCCVCALGWVKCRARIRLYVTSLSLSPIYLNSLMQTYAPSRSLRFASKRLLVVPSQRGTKSLSRTFSWIVPSWWNDLPIGIWTAESLAIFKKTTKDIFFASTWLTNTNTYDLPILFYSILFYSILFYSFQFYKKTSYVYCTRLTATCHGTCILLFSQWSDCFYYSPHLYVDLDKSVC